MKHGKKSNMQSSGRSMQSKTAQDNGSLESPANRTAALNGTNRPQTNRTWPTFKLGSH